MQTHCVDSSSLKPLILIVDDEPDLITLLKRVFEREKYQVATAREGEEAIWVLRRSIGQDLRILVILDLMLPVRTGFEICRFIRSTPELSGTPVLAISAQAGTEVKVRALEEGADDFLEKPFSTRELLARVNALIRRCQKVDSRDMQPIRFLFGPLVVDTQRREILLEGKEIFLTRLEFQILHYFILHQGVVVRKDELIEFLWNESEPVGDDNLKVHVHALRRKLGDQASKPRFIETLRGFGYRFKNRWDASLTNHGSRI
ncbi:MAG: response regulator transcription factor [Leptospirales bacterium]